MNSAIIFIVLVQWVFSVVISGIIYSLSHWLAFFTIKVKDCGVQNITLDPIDFNCMYQKIFKIFYKISFFFNMQKECNIKHKDSNKNILI